MDDQSDFDVETLPKRARNAVRDVKWHLEHSTGVAWSDWAAKEILYLCRELAEMIERRRNLLHLFSMPPLEACQKHQFQNCGVCSRIECCDNYNPLKERIGKTETKLAQALEALRLLFYARTASGMKISELVTDSVVGTVSKAIKEIEVAQDGGESDARQAD